MKTRERAWIEGAVGMILRLFSRKIAFVEGENIQFVLKCQNFNANLALGQEPLALTKDHLPSGVTTLETQGNVVVNELLTRP